MKRILIYLTTALFIGQASAQEFRPGMLYTPDHTPGDTLKIMAYNTENLTDLKDNLYINNRMEDSQDKKKEEKAALLVKVIKAANADIVMISEFETVAYLRELSQKNELGYKYFASSESQTWYQNTMIMSKVPIGTFRTYGSVYSPIVGEKDEQGKQAMQININSRMWIAEVWPTAGQRLYLCGVHLKAGRNKSDTATRIGQTALLKGEFERIVKEDKKACILMAGDFNSTPESDEFKMLQQGSKRARFIDPLAGTSVYSHPAGNPRWRIDHMVFNKNLSAKIVPGSTGPAYILSKEEMTEMSDHLPVVTKILLH
ncbi:endonuclease/exonuclease/phosphatase family protein [Chitinophaga niabensis]|uniref:Metal-dependent hydrolase, endonuclease/exonuclease/phosphatase family n=1 Tax=Chitinophaga niabensis TaxID=536979 RepID=A0A1N6D6H3_9BACT|nr:endonuclease/exonuclease/phosphatase family protein [Chitinophaga niabensis]SIN66430.1 Metal-dependent hydrolase, endonuclease/exonuclease/phosphatase family [Chitinophaga niabensis]